MRILIVANIDNFHRNFHLPLINALNGEIVSFDIETEYSEEDESDVEDLTLKNITLHYQDAFLGAKAQIHIPEIKASGKALGDFYAGNDFIIRQATGTIEGRTFTKALSAQFTPLNLALEN